MQARQSAKYMSMKEFVAEVRRREGMRATLIAAIEAWTTGPGILVLSLLASVVFVAFGGSLEPVSEPKAETSIAAVAARPADTGGVSRNENISASSAEPTDYFPSGYVTGVVTATGTP